MSYVADMVARAYWNVNSQNSTANLSMCNRKNGMKRENNSEERLGNKLTELRRRVEELEKAQAEHKRAEDALRESEQHYRLITENTSDLIAITTFGIKPVYTYASPSHRDFGYEPEELLGKSGFKFIHPDDKKRLRTLLGEYVRKKAKNLLAGKETDIVEKIEFRFRDKAGRWRYIASTVNIIKDKFLLLISRDITEKKRAEEALHEAHAALEDRVKERTAELSDANVALKREIAERRQAEEALRESEERYRKLSEHSSDAIYITAREGTISYCNKSFLDLFGYAREEAKGLKAQDAYVYPDDRSRFQREIEKKGSVRDFELRLQRKDGTEMDCLLTATVRKGDDGTILGYQGIIRDITERKRAEEALRESERKYRTILENIEEGYFEVDLAGNLTFFNDAVCRIAGFPRDELTGMNNRGYTTPETAKTMYEFFNKIYRTGRPAKLMDYEIIGKDGRTVVLEMSASLMTDGNGEPIGFRGVVRDVTDRKHAEEERRKLEAQLTQAQKLEALGTLAGGIAHDFNNLLTGIQGNASLMLYDIDPGHTHYEKLKSIESMVKSGVNLTRQLLGFSRRGKYEVKAADLNQLIKRSSAMFGRTKREISIHTHFQEGIWPVEVDQGQIEQVLLNLYVNAWQAMPGGGTLCLETENLSLDENYIKPHEVKPGRYVKVSVTDTGVGMDKATQERIFDPFFTTKGMGRGTGLGLASAYGIIKNHGGIINVYSEKGKGTTFHIYLPVSETKVIEEKMLPGQVLRGSETVLLVDDEDFIITVGSQMLKKLGYTVLTAVTGKDAVECYTSNRKKIDLVILDMIMPDMGGGETYDKMKELDPDLKALLSSGYSINGQAKDILQRGCNGFIPKPFDMKTLSNKIREVLDTG
jgi:two-component system cell cycle sensor histidine kinase/response regulator CckA